MMTQEQFIYWLRGFLSGKNYICTQEVELLKEELAKVNVVTYSMPVVAPLHEPYIKGPSDCGYSKMPMFT